MEKRPNFTRDFSDDDDIVLVTADDLPERRGIYEQDVEVNSNLYKGFTVYPAVPLDHRH